ncbi:hypothetical protein OGAPHI_002312 [Ogataea philodendri]|uniref:Large ribosomal subunit protein mL46 n=1 Tax=Ogataea philodendri TaxID=1378263 RepID=A0A9P8PA95_9ASCO|nr:uncharacterized protein OGAPHI_002312 [Ogataea philodendri]KAH3668558.1 hypothetical protein OGAPHI_002312 [Ogataea philodendri]
MNKLIWGRRYLSTSTSTPLKNVHAGAILSRVPQVTADMSEFEKKFYKYQDELQRRLMWTFPRWFYFKKGTVAEREFAQAQTYPIQARRGVWFPQGKPEIRHGRDRRFKEVIVLPKFGSSDKSDQAPESREENLDDASRPINPMPRITEADKSDNKLSLERSLSRTLYLLVKQNNSWKFPAFEVADDSKPLHLVAEDGLKSLGGDKLNIWTVSNTPTALIKFSKGKIVSDMGEDGVREYLIKSHIVAGDFKLNKIQGCQEYKWLTREEIQELTDPEYFAKVDCLLSKV